MSETEPALAQNTYAEEAISIRALAAQAKSAEVRVQLLQIAALYEKLAHLVGDAAVQSLIAMASTLHGDLALHGDLLTHATRSGGGAGSSSR
jgi:hypothetical protein